MLKSKLILCVIILLFSLSGLGKDIYFYTNDIPGLVGKVRIFNDEVELAEIGNNQYIFIQIGDVSRLNLTFKWGLRLNKKIEIEFANKEVAFVYIFLDPSVWSVQESYYPKIPYQVKEIFDFRKEQSEITTRVNLHPKTGFNKSNIIEYLEKPTSPFEGIYEIAENSDSPNYEVAVIKTELGFTLVYLSGGNDAIWNEGDVKAYLTSTSNPAMFRVKWYLAEKRISEDVYISFEDRKMKVVWIDEGAENFYLKLFPLSKSEETEFLASGSGFALSSDGFIVTNFHVVEGAESITVKGINGDFTLAFNAKIVVSDKNNDLAILKIDDNSFTSIPRIPYMVKSTTSDVGESVFVLGYPLRATMGDEIKLTNGIISSKTGFQGDITSYQISAPVQPGNSGGPLFDKSGNLIGVINAKHLGAENVSYAIKISYLKSLIDLLPSAPVMNKTTTLTNRSLSEQVKLINRFVYIIEVR